MVTPELAALPERVLQVRGVDPDILREMRIERVRREVTLADLLHSMWHAYAQQLSIEQPKNGAPHASSRKRRS